MSYRVSEGAEPHIGVTYPIMLEGSQVGEISLVDYMGTDLSIVNAARVSYTNQPRKRDDKALIDYLWKHQHTSPFEQVMLTFRVKSPLYVARQWMRHRTQAINEESRRYSEANDQFYTPGLNRLQVQDIKNKQASGSLLVENPEECLYVFETAQAGAFTDYQKLLDEGLSRELARGVLPVSQMTHWVFSQSLRNLLHFHRLRQDSHAQPEIRVFADKIGDILRDGWPMTMEAYDNYRPWTVDQRKFDLLDETTKEALRSVGIQL